MGFVLQVQQSVVGHLLCAGMPRVVSWHDFVQSSALSSYRDGMSPVGNYTTAAGQQTCHRHCTRHSVGLPADDKARQLHQEGPFHEHPHVAGGLGWPSAHACHSQA